MIVFKQKGDFSKTEKFLSDTKKKQILNVLTKYAAEGVTALASNTPVDSGETANSWGYKIISSTGRYRIIFTNSHVVNGVPIAIIIQYGHATQNGGYVEGRDYINPAIQPIFDRILKDAWREVTR